jgi:hypothetical protein
VAQARYKTASETDGQWVNALAGAERGATASVRLQVCAGWIEEADSGGQTDVRGMLGMYCGTLARRGVHQGPDAVRYGPVSAAAAIKPDGLNDGHIETLKNAGYVTVRKITGLTASHRPLAKLPVLTYNCLSTLKGVLIMKDNQHTQPISSGLLT